MAEEVLGIVLHVLQSTGRIESRLYTIIVTDQRMIVARFTAQMMADALAQSKANLDRRGGEKPTSFRSG